MKNPTFNYSIKNVRREIMTDPVYFGLSGISNSKLGLLNPKEGGSYTKFMKSVFDTVSESLEIGSAVHRIILENHIIEEVEKPAGKIASLIEFVVNQEELYPNVDKEDHLTAASMALEYYAKNFSDRRREKVWKDGTEYYNYLKEVKALSNNNEEYIVLNKKNKKTVLECVKSINKNKTITNLLKPTKNKNSYNEDVIIMEVDVEGEPMEFKAKIDNWTIDPVKKKIILNDLKTTGKPVSQFGGYDKTFIYLKEGEIVTSKGKAEGSFQSYHYYRQMGMYLWMLLEYLKSKMDISEYTIDVNMLVVETAYGKSSQVFEVSDRWLNIGIDEFSELIKYLIECKNKKVSKKAVIKID